MDLAVEVSLSEQLPIPVVGKCQALYTTSFISLTPLKPCYPNIHEAGIVTGRKTAAQRHGVINQCPRESQDFPPQAYFTAPAPDLDILIEKPFRFKTCLTLTGKSRVRKGLT